jgi:hypothetical protein
MFSEIIYTRCREGFNLQRNCARISSEGFKVYSCTQKLHDRPGAELAALQKMTQIRLPYHDPDFMDDAYLYSEYQPGKYALLNFHPFKFDSTAKGNYSHRPGNYINQLLVGSFENIYPSSLIGNESVWTASVRPEAYYYENTPSLLEERDLENFSVSETQNPKISAGGNELPDARIFINAWFGILSGFITPAKRILLKKAVAFILNSFSENSRYNYLIIKESSSRNIELWIGAIQAAFSPRIAESITFATRLDKASENNICTVGSDGFTCTSFEYSNPRNNTRTRARIVGTVKDDKVNFAVTESQNSPYAVLDGINETFNCSLDISDPWFDGITSFDRLHQNFNCIFLQNLKISIPDDKVFKLWHAYLICIRFTDRPDLNTMTEAFSELSKISDYGEINIPSFLQSVSSFVELSGNSENIDRIESIISATQKIHFSLSCNVHLKNIAAAIDRVRTKIRNLSIASEKQKSLIEIFIKEEFSKTVGKHFGRPAIVNPLESECINPINTNAGTAETLKADLTRLYMNIRIRFSELDHQKTADAITMNMVDCFKNITAPKARVEMIKQLGRIRDASPGKNFEGGDELSSAGLNIAPKYPNINSYKNITHGETVSSEKSDGNSTPDHRESARQPNNHIFDYSRFISLCDMNLDILSLNSTGTAETLMSSSDIKLFKSPHIIGLNIIRNGREWDENIMNTLFRHNFPSSEDQRYILAIADLFLTNTNINFFKKYLPVFFRNTLYFSQVARGIILMAVKDPAKAADRILIALKLIEKHNPASENSVLSNIFSNELSAFKKESHAEYCQLMQILRDGTVSRDDKMLLDRITKTDRSVMGNLLSSVGRLFGLKK